MKAHTKETQDILTPEHALEILKEGNERFVNNIKAHRDLLEQVNVTSSGQFPFAAILSCIDSRTSAELIFDQGLGDIFSIRIAGNILNEDILGSMEFACKIAGSKLIVVLGHTKCGAIEYACNDIVLGNITNLLNKIKPAIQLETETKAERNGNNRVFMNNVTTNNVHLTVKKIKEQSTLLAELEASGEIKIIGGLYDLDTGLVTFFE
ncbi:MAG: carbonic anhydrase [Bacteroidetes bacterium]|nr:carbonic anhydrase [Bacteroidota bacterium]MBK9412747.1 carbonic anhydrase [Bacteroidota bacterium]MBL0031935.1 carbonic anhydrase [Bacteroidota bacterium]MBP6428061.1 carbonic anhydrase [Bacteroidia bacterium]MBP6657285.1 carbonic anhydrase [Bacteroidia bacterium]